MLALAAGGGARIPNARAQLVSSCWLTKQNSKLKKLFSKREFTQLRLLLEMLEIFARSIVISSWIICDEVELMQTIQDLGHECTELPAALSVIEGVYQVFLVQVVEVSQEDSLQLRLLGLPSDNDDDGDDMDG